MKKLIKECILAGIIKETINEVEGEFTMQNLLTILQEDLKESQSLIQGFSEHESAYKEGGEAMLERIINLINEKI